MSSGTPTIDLQDMQKSHEGSFESKANTYTKKATWIIVMIVAAAGLFSPLPGTIYYPAMPELARAFDRSIEQLNLTVTVYLVFQGVAPMLWGPLSDRFGRRPIFLICLLILVLDGIGLALVPVSALWLLSVLRCIQSFGCASTIALGAGVIGDITRPEERAGYFAMFNLGPMIGSVIGLSIGPPIGGALSEHLGWRSIFWFLAIVSFVCLLLIALLFPETLRHITTNPNFRPRGLYRPFICLTSPQRSSDSTHQLPLGVTAKPALQNPLIILTYPDVLLALFITGIVHAVNWTITTTIATSFNVVYHNLSTSARGLCYLPSGLGILMGSISTGKFLNWDYGRLQIQLAKERTSEDRSGRGGGFEVERARLRTMPYYLCVFAACVVGWGWALSARVHLAGVLALQVLLGWTSISILNTTCTLLIDILPDRSSAAIACNNLIRCSFAALLVGLIDQATEALGYGLVYSLLGGVCFALLGPLWVEMRCGARMRARRVRRARSGGRRATI